MKNSLIILLCFIAGILLGRLAPQWSQLTNQSGLYVLMLLMLLVGFSVGSDRNTLKAIKNINRRYIWLPIGTIAGTLIASFLISFTIGLKWNQCMAIGSGFGYYSLSSILITQYLNAELGTIALLTNVIREMFTLLLAPIMIRYFGKLAPIASGGATTMDTALPIITQVSGKEMAIVAIFHGIIVDFTVPFLVTFFCSFH